MRKNLKKLLVVSAAVSMIAAFAACGAKKTGNDNPTTGNDNPDTTVTLVPTEGPTLTPAPTDAPTDGPTPTPVPSKAPTPTPVPTQAPADGKVVVHSIDGEGDISSFSSRGNGTAVKGEKGCNSDGSIQVTGRSATWHGVTLVFTDADGKEHDVIGKEVSVSFDVYQETGAPITISCTLQVNQSDGTTTWPERIATEGVPSGEWVHVEGVIPVYADVSAPSLNFETMGDGSETAEFFLDNVVVSYDPNSSGDPTPTPEPTQAPADGKVVVYNIDGEGDISSFSSRGSGTAVKGEKGCNSDGSIQVTGRSATWHGVTLGFTGHDVIGKEVSVSFDVYQETGAPIAISCTLQVNKPDGNATWPERVAVEAVPSGEWVHVEGVIPVYANVTAPSLNFETMGDGTETAEFFLDNVVVSYDTNSSVDPKEFE